jgi:uncharacterized protein HemY
VKGCHRGTTKFAPGCRVICGQCWRRAPKAMRHQANVWAARARRFEQRGDIERADVAHLWSQRLFENIRKLLSGELAEPEGMDPLMEEELRKAGLL